MITIQNLRAELKFTDEQSNQLRDLQQKLVNARRGLDRSDRAAYTAKNQELAAASDQEVEKLLTPEQNAKLKELLGPPFTGEIRQPFFSGPTSSTSRGVVGRDAGDRGRGPFEVGSRTRTPWNYLSYPDVQKDLKLTDEQRQKLPSLGQFGTRGEDVQKVLTAEQVARLWQLQLQIGQQRSGPAYIFRYRDVAEALSFTEEQKKSLAAAESSGVGVGNGRTREQAQQQIAEILSEEQEAKLKALLGQPFTGEIPRSLSFPAAGTGDGSRTQSAFQIASTSQTPGGWLRYPAVREDLKLSEDQSQKVNAILQRERTIASRRAGRVVDGRAACPPAGTATTARAAAERAGLPVPLSGGGRALGLSDEQKRKIEQLAKSYNQFRPSESVQQIRSRLDEILTAEQQRRI